jgi:hypothetical protein
MSVRSGQPGKKKTLPSVVLEKCEEIRQSREYLLRKIRTLSQALAELQDNCPHFRRTREARSDTGNYDRSLDRYWWRCRCPDCDKVWDEEQ